LRIRAIVTVALLASGSALAESLDAEAALRFVVGKLFTFSCFDGSRGVGRFYADGSVTARYGCRRERSKSKARRSVHRLTACRLSHALISIKQMIKVSAAQFWAWISPIATSPT